MQMKGFKLVLILLTAVACETERPKSKETPLTKEERIVDGANIITQSAEDSIFSLIQNLEKNIGSQIAIVTIDTLNGEDINTFSIRTAEQMQLGRDKYLDGVLMTFSLRDKLMRIEVGYGLETILKDEIAKKICSDVIAPKFREENYGLGIFLGATGIKELIEQNEKLVGQMWSD
jgi:uncharacterized membrane protein YgcG